MTKGNTVIRARYARLTAWMKTSEYTPIATRLSTASQRTRAGEGSMTLYGRRLAVHLLVQPAVAREFMADPKATGHDGGRENILRFEQGAQRKRSRDLSSVEQRQTFLRHQRDLGASRATDLRAV